MDIFWVLLWCGASAVVGSQVGRAMEQQRWVKGPMTALTLERDELKKIVDEFEEFRSEYYVAGVTETDLMMVANEYAEYRKRWYRIFGQDPAGLTHPRKNFQQWWVWIRSDQDDADC